MIENVQKGRRVIFRDGSGLYAGTIEDVFDNVCRVSCEQTTAYCHIVEKRDLFDSIEEAFKTTDEFIKLVNQLHIC